MRKACILIVWGLIFSRVHIRIEHFDLLMDSIGYLLIFIGLGVIVNEHQTVSKARIYAFILIFLSIPYIVIPFDIVPYFINDFWYFYLFIVQILDLLLIFYLFKSLLGILSEVNDVTLLNKTRKVFVAYISVTLAIIFMQTFIINFSTEQLLGLIFFSAFIGLIMEIVLIALLLQIRHIDQPKDHNKKVANDGKEDSNEQGDFSRS